MGLRVHYSVNFTSQISGTNDIQETKCNSMGKNAALLPLAKNTSNHRASHGEEGLSEAVILKDTSNSRRADSKLDMPVS